MHNPTPIEPLYITSLEEVLWGGTLVLMTMTMHGFGILGVLRVNHILKHWLAAKKHVMAGLLPVIVASWMIMIVHIVEAMLWAAFFLWKGAFPNRSLAYYFALNEYTTVGSNYSLPLQWRLLEGMIATAGLLAFAWSTGVLVMLGQEFQNQRMQLFREQFEKERSRLTSDQAGK